MPANGKYWKRHWQKRSQAVDELIVSGWGNRDIREYLYDICDISKKLKLKNSDSLLNIGCGNGLMEIVLSYWVKRINSIDFSLGMIKKAKANNRGNDNVAFLTGTVLDLSFLKNCYYDKVLCNSVIQYLSDINEVACAFEEIRKISKSSTRILISANPDKSKMNKFLSGYDKLNLAEEDKTKKKEINKLSLWTSPNEVESVALKLGFKTKILKMHPYIWQSWYMYDLLMWR